MQTWKENKTKREVDALKHVWIIKLIQTLFCCGRVCLKNVNCVNETIYLLVLFIWDSFLTFRQECSKNVKMDKNLIKYKL